METLVGRDVEVPRAIFARDIQRGASNEPPNGEYWIAKVTEYNGEVRGCPFTLALEVLDDNGELELEDQDASLSQVRKWLAAGSLMPHESRDTVGHVIVPAKTPKTTSKAKTVRMADVFATPQDSRRYKQASCRHHMLSCAGCL